MFYYNKDKIPADGKLCPECLYGDLFTGREGPCSRCIYIEPVRTCTRVGKILLQPQQGLNFSKFEPKEW